MEPGTDAAGAATTPNDTSPMIGKIALALAKAQVAFAAVERSRTVNVRSDKGNYSFSYAPLDVVLAAVRKPLCDNELAVTQSLRVDGRIVVVRTLLLHSSGEWLGSTLVQPMPEKVQQLGSAITYLRRYALVALLGLASEEDDDGNAADGNHATGTERRRGKVDLGAGAAKVAAPPPAGLERRPDDGTISDAQRKRLWAIANAREKATGTAAKMIIDRVMQDEGVPVDDAGHRIITRAKYESICKAVDTYTSDCPVCGLQHAEGACKVREPGED